MKKFVACLAVLWAFFPADAQQVSIATDVSALRSFAAQSRFFAIGQTVQAQYHFSAKTTGYGSIRYYSNGRFRNTLQATARDSTVFPAIQNFSVRTQARYRHLSFGLKHYLKGAYNNESGWNLYAITGFGLLLAKVENTHAPAVDASLYFVPYQGMAGSKNVVRLTADLGLGAEMLLGSGIYLYTDAHTWIKASSNRSPYLFSNEWPRVLALSFGVRILLE